MTDMDSRLARMEERIEHLIEGHIELKALVKVESRNLRDELRNYVRLEVFEPVRLIVFGLVGMTMAAVTTGVIALVVQG